MKQNNSRLLFFAIGFSLFMADWTQGFAAEKAPFYQGKTLNFIINFAAGGPTDIESRIFAKHLSKHIPGQPAVVVQAMGGGGGLTAVNYIGEVAKPDGLTAAYFTGSLFQHQIKDPALRVDIGKFGFITGVQGVTVSYIRSDVGPGIKKALGLREGRAVQSRRAGCQQLQGCAFSVVLRLAWTEVRLCNRLQLKFNRAARSPAQRSPIPR
jgi:hypothetical protein